MYRFDEHSALELLIQERSLIMIIRIYSRKNLTERIAVTQVKI